MNADPVGNAAKMFVLFRQERFYNGISEICEDKCRNKKRCLKGTVLNFRNADLFIQQQLPEPVPPNGLQHLHDLQTWQSL